MCELKQQPENTMTTYVKRIRTTTGSEYHDFNLMNHTKTHGARRIGARVTYLTHEYIDAPATDMWGTVSEFRGSKLAVLLRLMVGNDTWGPGMVFKEFDNTPEGEDARAKFVEKKLKEVRARQAKKLELA